MIRTSLSDVAMTPESTTACKQSNGKGGTGSLFRGQGGGARPGDLGTTTAADFTVGPLENMLPQEPWAPAEGLCKANEDSGGDPGPSLALGPSVVLRAALPSGNTPVIFGLPLALQVQQAKGERVTQSSCHPGVPNSSDD